MEFKVLLNMVEDVKNFVKIAEKYDMDITVRSTKSKFEVDGTSIMGMFTLDLSDPVIVTVYNDDNGKKFKSEVEKYIVH